MNIIKAHQKIFAERYDKICNNNGQDTIEWLLNQ